MTTGGYNPLSSAEAPPSKSVGAPRTIAMPLGLGKILLTQRFAVAAAVSSLVGALLGVICSMVINSTLVEISLSAFFATYFGIMFLCVGGAILWRLHSNKDINCRRQRNILSIFGALVIVSGFLCFMLERNWFVGMRIIAKVPLYSILGLSVAFALTFTIVDLINYTLGFFQSAASRAIIESPQQVYLVLCVAVAMGCIFGCIFGLMGVDNEVGYRIQLTMLREEHTCYPIGVLLGGLAGFYNECIKQQEEIQARSVVSHFDLDI